MASHIAMVKGSLLDQQVDVIVNVTSPSLNLGVTGLSQKVLEAAGDGIQTECNQKYPGGIQVGDVAVTSGGNLTCKAIYHGACSKKGENNADTILQTFVMNCLNEAHADGYSSLAMSAVGTGLLGYKPAEAADLVIGQIKQFYMSNPSSCLQQIYIVTLRSQKHIHTAFVSECGSGATGGTPVKYKSYLRLVEGNLLHQKVDVIVNNVDDVCNLGRGVLSGKILKIGGQQIQDECTSNAPNGLDHGEIIVTGNGNLNNCKAVYHGFCGNYSDPGSCQTFRTMVRNCLVEADSSGYTSIALPALGTGSPKFPHEEAAQLMEDETRAFRRTHPATPLKDIRVVVFDAKARHAFLKILGTSTSTVTRVAGTITISIVQGSLVDQNADALVCCTSRDLNLANAPLSNKILEAAGPSIQTECTNFAPKGIQYGELVYTGPGNMRNCKSLYHGSCMDYGNTNSEQALREFIQRCLAATQKHGYHSIAFPALGTGNLKFPLDIAAHLFVDEVNRFSHKNPTCSLKQVTVIVLPNETNTYKAFVDRVNKPGGAGRRRLITTQLSMLSLTDPMEKGMKLVFPTWCAMAEDKEYENICLQPSDAEYKTVATAFQSQSRQTVKAVYRIQNANLAKMFVFKKLSLEKKLSRTNVDLKLWHGTQSAALVNIFVNGFNRSYCGRNATAYGNGVYFAKCASYSSQPQYAVPDPSTGIKYVISSRVLVGKYTQGGSGMLEPPSGYHSVVDNVTSPSIFVVFRDADAYPEYFIQF